MVYNYGYIYMYVYVLYVYIYIYIHTSVHTTSVNTPINGDAKIPMRCTLFACLPFWRVHAFRAFYMFVSCSCFSHLRVLSRAARRLRLAETHATFSQDTKPHGSAAYRACLSEAVSAANWGGGGGREGKAQPDNTSICKARKQACGSLHMSQALARSARTPQGSCFQTSTIRGCALIHSRGENAHKDVWADGIAFTTTTITSPLLLDFNCSAYYPVDLGSPFFAHGHAHNP